MNGDQRLAVAVLDTVAAPGNLAAVTCFVRDHCAAPGQDTAPLDLIVEEVFLNIATHACPNQPVRIACSTTSPGASLEFVYGGPAFDPTVDASPPDLDAPSVTERRIGGLGVFLVLRTAESVTYRREGAVNRLAVRVLLPAP